MSHLLAVGCGGFAGALLRYGATTWILRMPAMQECPIPLPTFLVNLSGCFLIGALKGLTDGLHWFSPTMSLLIFTGVLGSFTTFSSFGFESWTLIENGKFIEVILYVALSVVLGLILVWLGYAGASRLMENP